MKRREKRSHRKNCTYKLKCPCDTDQVNKQIESISLGSHCKGPWLRSAWDKNSMNFDWIVLWLPSSLKCCVLKTSEEFLTPIASMHQGSPHHCITNHCLNCFNNCYIICTSETGAIRIKYVGICHNITHRQQWRFHKPNDIDCLYKRTQRALAC